MYVVELPAALRIIVGPFETLDEAIAYVSASGRQFGTIIPVFEPTVPAKKLVETPNMTGLEDLLK